MVKLNMLGLLALAALTVAAVVATPAQAKPQFHVESAPAIIKAEQVGPMGFHTPSGTISCNTATYNGTSQVTTTATQTLEVATSECTAFGFLGAAIHMNGCDYLFHLTSSTTSPYAITVDLLCPPGKAIEVTAPFGCTTTVGPQSGLGGISMTNNGTKTTRDLKVGLKIVGIHGTANANCPVPGTISNGEFTGEGTLKAYTEGGAQQGLWVA